MKLQVGDKVCVKATKKRGVVDGLGDGRIHVRLDDGSLVAITESEITNYSLAARKAWKNMPSRSVGRPKGTTTTDRVSVTLRIDRETWEAFRRAEQKGVIVDRTTTINQWIAEKLGELNK